MIIEGQSPCRISLFGSGTDIPAFAKKYGGLVIGMAINLRQHMTMYSEDNLFEIGKSSFPINANPDFYYRILAEYGINDGMHLTKLKCSFDGLINGGLGSSASAAVLLVGLINKRKNLNMNLYEIAEKAWDLEVNKIGLFGGRQDQLFAAFGGVNAMLFTDKVEVKPLAKEFINPILPALVLLYTGANRKSAKIQEGLKLLTLEQIDILNKIKYLASEAIDPIAKGEIDKVGFLLDKSWELKKQSNKGVSNPDIDKIYLDGLRLGAYGGKLLGSGSGGFMLFVVDPKNRYEFVQKMGLEEYDFDISWDGLQVRRLPE